jgi:hypothetical protein
MFILILATGLPTAYLYGKADGYRAGADYALAEMETQLGPAVERAMIRGGEIGINETVNQYTPILAKWEQLSKDLLADLQSEREWNTGFARHAADWIYGDQDAQMAHDLLWCAMGLAYPFDDCLQMLEDGRK